MTLGLGSYTFRWSIGHRGIVPETPMSAMEVLDIADAHGLKVVQYADNIPLEYLSEDEVIELRKSADAKGIALELGTETFDAEEVSRYIKIGGMIDSKIIRVALDKRDAEKPVVELAAEFRELMPDVKAAGMRMAVENHFNFPSPRLIRLIELIASDDLGVCLDLANSICAGEWPMETIGMLAPYTINLHLKDYIIQPDPYGVGFRMLGCPLGTGRVDLDAVMDAVSHCPDEMSILLEHWLPIVDADLESACKTEHVWLEKHIAAAKAALPANRL